MRKTAATRTTTASQLLLENQTKTNKVPPAWRAMRALQAAMPSQ
jgi:hypothetical protein